MEGRVEGLKRQLGERDRNIGDIRSQIHEIQNDWRLFLKETHHLERTPKEIAADEEKMKAIEKQIEENKKFQKWAKAELEKLKKEREVT